MSAICAFQIHLPQQDIVPLKRSGNSLDFKVQGLSQGDFQSAKGSYLGQTSELGRQTFHQRQHTTRGVPFRDGTGGWS